MTEDATFIALAQPDFDTLNTLFKRQFPECRSADNFTPEQQDFIQNHYWSYNIFGQLRVELLYKEILEIANRIKLPAVICQKKKPL